MQGDFSRLRAALETVATATIPRRCDCEADNCHSHADCKTNATTKVQAFGYGQWLCDTCLALAKKTLGSDLVTDPARFE